MKNLPLVLALYACAPEPRDPDALFGVGRADEQVTATAIGASALQAPDGLLAGRGVAESVVLSTKIDATDMAHVKVQQLHQGVPVFGGEAIAHLSPTGRLVGFTDGLVTDIVVDPTPDFDPDEAIAFAIDAAGLDALSDDPIAELFVLRRDGEDRLVYGVQLEQLLGDGHDTMPYVFVDAHDGSVVWSYENLQTATCSGSTNHYGTVSFECYAPGDGSYFTENQTDNLAAYTWGHGSSSLYYVGAWSTTFGTDEYSKSGVEALYVSKQVSDYYGSAHARDGIDELGGPAAVTSHGASYLTSTVNYGTKYVNAFWSPTGKYMTYGDGDGVTSDALSTLDIGGHEFAHGVTQYEANLTYSGEPGHLNESYSDVFGAMVERSVSGESANTWKIGETTWTPSLSGDALRYMADPAADGVSWDYASTGVGSVDVHYGSGVPNLAFYLMANGGSHPRGKSTTVVTGIGAEKAAKIWYLALTSYLTSSSDFAAAHTAQLAAAGALYGTSSAEYTAVGDAWGAVGVGATSGSSGSGTTTSTCTSNAFSGSATKKSSSYYKPTTTGTSLSAASHTITLAGPSGTNFDLYLEKKSGTKWLGVASSTTSGTSTETISYTGASGIYRIRVYTTSGTGTYSGYWCR